MIVRLTGTRGQTVQQAVSERLSAALGRLRNAARPMAESMEDDVRSHFAARWPGSSHYDPEKVSVAGARDGELATAAVDVDVPGAARAYRDMHIKPRFRRYLAIPFGRFRGKKPSDFADAFFLKKRDGKAFLARRDGNGISFLFSLVKGVFQPRDPGIMPSDRTLFKGMANRIFELLGGTSRHG